MPSPRTLMLGIPLALVVVFFGLWCLYGFLAVRGIETPQYTVLSEGEGYEIRQYDELIVASTTVDGDLDQATNDGFRRVAGYIFGENALNEKIAMTAPVTAEANEQKQQYTISFVMPSALSMEELPLPTNSAVRVETVKNKTFAVLRFSGLVHEADVEERKTAFQQQLETDGVLVSGDLILAQYNPPFTPWFMRRNELWAPVSMDD